MGAGGRRGRRALPRGGRGGDQLLRHRRHVLAGAQRGSHRALAARADPPRRGRRGEQALLPVARGAELAGALPQARLRRLRRLVAPPRPRHYRPLSDPPMGSRHADRGDPGGARRAGASGEGALPGREQHGGVAVREGDLHRGPPRSAPIRIDAEPLQPHLPRRRAGDDPSLRRGGDRRDPVEPACAWASGRQSQAHGAGTHRAREERRLHAPALHRRRLRRRGRGGGGGARARNQAGAGRAGMDPPGAGGHRADRGSDAPGASPGGDSGGLDPARLGRGGARWRRPTSRTRCGGTTRPWPAGEPSRRRAARRPSTAVRRAAKRGPLRRGRRARAERRRDATPAPTGSARRRARRRSRRRPR